MSEDTLLMLFIGLIAVAAVSTAAAVGVVAWAVIKLVTEARLFISQMRKLGRSGEEVLRETGNRIRSVARSFLPNNSHNHGKNK